jgi:hypothetical protein
MSTISKNGRKQNLHVQSTSATSSDDIRFLMMGTEMVPETSVSFDHAANGPRMRSVTILAPSPRYLRLTFWMRTRTAVDVRLTNKTRLGNRTAQWEQVHENHSDVHVRKIRLCGRIFKNRKLNNFYARLGGTSKLLDRFCSNSACTPPLNFIKPCWFRLILRFTLPNAKGTLTFTYLFLASFGRFWLNLIYYYSMVL